MIQTCPGCPRGRTSVRFDTCFSRDGDGDGVSYWWVVDSAGTEDCPDLCGSFTYYGGYGKYAGMTGSGTWRRNALVGGMGMGTWSSSYSIQ